MSIEQINDLANAIADQQALRLGMSFFWGMLITAICAAGAAYLGSYLRERGKNYATKQDFDGLLDQVRKTTEATSQIKSQIDHADWLKREATSIKRQKAESLIISMYEARDYLQSVSKQVLFGNLDEVDYSPGSKASMLAGLYFPELTYEGTVFGTLCARMSISLRNFVLAKVHLTDDPSRLESAHDYAVRDFQDFNAVLLQLITYIEMSVANQMAEIAGATAPYKLVDSPAANIERMMRE